MKTLFFIFCYYYDPQSLYFKCHKSQIDFLNSKTKKKSWFILAQNRYLTPFFSHIEWKCWPFHNIFVILPFYQIRKKKVKLNPKFSTVKILWFKMVIIICMEETSEKNFGNHNSPRLLLTTSIFWPKNIVFFLAIAYLFNKGYDGPMFIPKILCFT